MTDGVDWTLDSPAVGVTVAQPRRGFRYGAEVFWLVGRVLADGVPATALDLGTGSGVMAWLLAAHGAAVDAVDVRPEWADGWARGAGPRRPTFHVGDVRSVIAGPPVDVVVCNPPFFPAGSGPAPSEPWRCAARFEGDARLVDFVQVAMGRARAAWFVVPVERADEVVAAAAPWSAEVIVVGAVRALVGLRPHGPTTRTIVPDRGPVVDGWYARARAVGLDPSAPGA